MGFPTWTLYGMGISALLALFMIALAYIGQSPRFMRKLGLDVYRLDLRVRAFTGYAFAFMLIAFGFFLAGVPLDGTAGIGAALGGDSSVQATEVPEETAEAIEDDEEMAGGESTDDLEGADLLSGSLPSATFTRPVEDSTPVTGAFGGLPSATNTATSSPADEDTETDSSDVEVAPSSTPGTTATAGPSPTRTPTSAPAATATVTPSPTPTNTPLPTATPTPTFTPTPIIGDIATVNSNGSNVWIYRSPGGQQLTLVGDGDTVILLPGHANQGGVLWQEIKTVEDSFTGWIEVSFLVFDGDGE